MSSLITITANAVSLQGFQITSNTDMLSALTYLVGLTSSPYSGSIYCNTASGTAVWTMTLNESHQNTSETANVGDWIILQNNAVATVCPQADFATLYSHS